MQQPRRPAALLDCATSGKR